MPALQQILLLHTFKRLSSAGIWVSPCQLNTIKLGREIHEIGTDCAVRKGSNKASKADTALFRTRQIMWWGAQRGNMCKEVHLSQCLKAKGSFHAFENRDDANRLMHYSLVVLYSHPHNTVGERRKGPSLEQG